MPLPALPQVVLKLIKHCQAALPTFVTGQLLGLDVGPKLEVTNCFPFPSKEAEQQHGTRTNSNEEEEDSAEYQMEMMRHLREVNVDNNTVGWYQSTYFSSFIDESCVETQFNYQVCDDTRASRRRPRADRHPPSSPSRTSRTASSSSTTPRARGPPAPPSAPSASRRRS